MAPPETASFENLESETAAESATGSFPGFSDFFIWAN
jgi:hypothetical protein